MKAALAILAAAVLMLSQAAAASVNSCVGIRMWNTRSPATTSERSLSAARESVELRVWHRGMLRQQFVCHATPTTRHDFCPNKRRGDLGRIKVFDHGSPGGLRVG